MNDFITHDPTDPDLGLFPPPASARNNWHGQGTPLDEHYLTEEAQRLGKRRYHVEWDDVMAQVSLHIHLKDTRSGIKNVKEKLVSHGNVILARWKKYSPDKRATILRASAKDAFRGAWQVVEAWKPDPEADPWGHTEPCISCIDWLTQSDIVQLAEDHARLMSLLHVRSTYEPQEWAAFDTRMSRRGFVVDSEGFHRFNASSVIMHGKAYGEVKQLNIDAARSYEEVGYPHAWAIFLMQKIVAQWLSAVVDLLSADAPPSGNNDWTAMIAEGLRSAHDQRLWSCYHHQEFAPPSTFDPNAMLKKARDHMNLLTEEIEELQTRPEAMRQYVLEEKANARFADNKNKEEKWQYVLQTLTLSWTRELERWQRLVTVCEQLKESMEKSGVSKVTGARLPKDADTAMRSFGRAVRQALEEAASEWASQTRTIDVMSEHLRKMLYVERKRVDPWNLNARLHGHRIIFWCLELAAAPEKNVEGFSWELQRLKQELDGTTYSTSLENWMSGIALLDEFLVSWSFRQTIDHPMEGGAINFKSKSKPKVFSRTFDITDWQIEEGFSKKPGNLECSQLLRRFCELPLPKGRRNMQWLEKMTNARESLTAVWTRIREAWDERQKEMGRSADFRQRFLSCMSYDISQEYSIMVEAERQQIQAEDETAKLLNSKKKQEPGFVQQVWDQKDSTDGTIRKTLTKKSNAIHDAVMIQDGLRNLAFSADSNSKDGDDIVRIAVKQETLDIVSQMFSTGDSSSGVRWVLLLQALTDAGLSARPGAGSAVTFANGQGAISVHQPHDRDGPVVDAIRLRGIGRRLTKWFGWTSETFVLRERGDKKS